VTATRKELREAGNFHTAKLIILRNPAPPKETLACKTQYREYYDKNGKHNFTLKLQKGKGCIKAWNKELFGLSGMQIFLS
jgi:hypothetical protein